MKLLEQYAESFETSDPVFRLTLDGGGWRISPNLGHPVSRYRPQPKTDDVLEELVCDSFTESFSLREQKFVIDHHQIANSAMLEIRRSFATFLERQLDMSSPRQSKLYRWFYRELPEGYDFNNDLVVLYKYLYSFAGKDMRQLHDKHTPNAIAILKAVMEKYEQK